MQLFDSSEIFFTKDLKYTLFYVQESIQQLDSTKKKEAGKKCSKVDALSWTVTFGCWGFILGVIGLISWAAVVILDEFYENRDEIESKNVGLQVIVSLMISVILWIFPNIFTLFSRYLEEYNERQRNYTDLTRAFLLESVLLGAVVIKNVKRSNQINDEVNLTTLKDYSQNSTGEICWENQVGEQMYELLILFVVILVLIPLLFETIQGLIYQG